MMLTLKSTATLLMTLLLSIAISSTNNQSWLLFWFALFFFAAIPLNFIFFRNLLTLAAPKWAKSSKLTYQLLAIFVAIIGYTLGVVSAT